VSVRPWAWPPMSPMTCCLWPVASKGRATSTTPAAAPPWPPTSSPLHPPAARPTHQGGQRRGLTNDGAWFTDSLQPQLYFVPVSQAGVPETTFRTLALSGPAAAISPSRNLPNLNGIRATPDGKTLIVAHTANAQLHTVDPTTGASATIAGISLPDVDGLLLEAGGCWRCRTSATRSAESGWPAT
jgi:hypothetical protein